MSSPPYLTLDPAFAITRAYPPDLLVVGPTVLVVELVEVLVVVVPAPAGAFHATATGT